MQKHVNVDLVKSFPMNICLQNLASIQKRASPVKFVHLAEKSGKGSISNLSTKVPPTVLKTREDPRRANLLAQSKGFLQTSGPYFLRGKGSQRAPVVKGKALYDVVPS